VRARSKGGADGIREEGELYPKDSEGFLLNPTSAAHIQEPWTPAVEEARELVRRFFGDRLHSLYLRGSVARGAARPNVSDIDLIVVTWGSVRASDRVWCGELSAVIVLHHPFVRRVDVSLTPLEHTVYGPVQFRLKLSSLFLWGNDLRPGLPRFRPEDEAALQYARTLGWDVGHSLVLLRGSPNAKELSRIRMWIGKTLVRAGFELVMAEVEGYTTDLYPCYEAFVARFPDRKADMRRALELAAGADASLDEAEELIVRLGLWLSAAVDRRFSLSRSPNDMRLDGAAKAPAVLELSTSEVLRSTGEAPPRLRAISSEKGEPLVALRIGRREVRLPRSFLDFMVGLCGTEGDFRVRDALVWDRTMPPAKAARLLASLVEWGMLRRITLIG